MISSTVPSRKQVEDLDEGEHQQLATLARQLRVGERLPDDHHGADQTIGEEREGRRNGPKDGGKNQITAAAQHRSDNPHPRRCDRYVPTNSATTVAT
jgi:hypothetical protein